MLKKLRRQKMSVEKDQAIEDFRQHVSSGKAAFFERYNMNFVSGARQGCWLEDIDAKHKLFNLHCNGGVFNLGHRNPELIQTLTDAMQQTDIGNHHLISQHRARLAKALCATMPEPLNRVVFGVSGGEAIDLAIKLSRGYTGRQNIISVTGGYHGHTGLALQAGDEQYLTPFNVHRDGFSQIPFNDLKALAAALNANSAAVILETIPATLGMVMPEDGYLTEVKALCAANGTLLILDEVQTGWGRTGKLWGFEHFNVIPDIVVLGKGMSGGLYPMSATVISEHLRSFMHEHPFAHVSTFGGSELGCAVAEKVLQISSAPEFLAHVNLLAASFAEALRTLEQTPMTGFRQQGLMMAIETKDELTGQILTKTAYDEGLLMIYANNRPSAVQFLPPLIMDPAEIPMIIERLKRALSKAKRLRTVLAIKDKLGL